MTQKDIDKQSLFEIIEKNFDSTTVKVDGTLDKKLYVTYNSTQFAIAITAPKVAVAFDNSQEKSAVAAASTPPISPDEKEIVASLIKSLQS